MDERTELPRHPRTPLVQVTMLLVLVAVMVQVPNVTAAVVIAALGLAGVVISNRTS